jgi:hypothetical protein
VVRVEPFHYTGKVWCLKVPTGCFVAWRDGMAFPTGNSGFPKSLDVSKAIDKAAGLEREVVGLNPLVSKQTGQKGTVALAGDRAANKFITAPATPEAQQWAGWGTALKPSWECITMARKPLSEGTVAANVLAHGTGGLNVDGCRVGTDDGLGRPYGGENKVYGAYGMERGTRTGDALTGRWPANLIHDGSDEVVGLFPDCKPATSRTMRSDRCFAPGTGYQGGSASLEVDAIYTDTGSAARFFYTAKASKSDRDKDNKHPTVKPTDLMRYLCRLVTPPGGIVLDPFMGSGSTGKGALLEGFVFIGIEREEESHATAEARLSRVASAGHQLGLTL